MTKLEYMKFHRAACDKMIAITKAKNADYCGISNDPFANFRHHGALGFHVRMHDKMSRIKSFIDKGFLKVKDESVLDTLLDLANYSLLMAGFITSQKGNTVGKKIKKVAKPAAKKPVSKKPAKKK